MITGDDLVADILARIAARLGADARILGEIEDEIRRDWGGETVYVARCPRARRRLLAAEARLLAARGWTVPMIAQALGVSESTVRRMLRGT